MSIRKRQWQSSGETKTGWVVDYRDQHGHRRLRTFASQGEAKAWSTTANYEVATGAHAADAKATLGSVLDLWIDHGVGEGLERSTIEQRKQHARLHIIPYLGRVRLSDLAPPRVHAYMDRLRDAGMSTAMRRKVLTSLSTVLAFARARGLTAQNAAAGIKVRKDERLVSNGPLKAGRDFPSKAELRALIDNAAEFWRPLIIVGIFSGMRISEIRGLRWRDVDLDAGVIHVTQRTDQFGAVGSLKSKAAYREIPLVPLALNALKQHRLRTGAGELVFTTRRGCPIVYGNFHRSVWRKLLDACGLGYEFHSLRHAAASLFIELGWAPKRVQAVMGHSSISMTYDRYGHLFPQGDIGEDLKRLEAAITAA
jgi:integrase